MNHQAIEVISQVISVVVIAAIVAAVWRVVESIKIRPLKRYFQVWYKCTNKDGENVNGRASVLTQNTYIDPELFSASVTSKNGSDSVFITNIIELSKADYEDFNR